MRIMKTLLLAALLVGVAVATYDRQYETFRPGKTYTFELLSQTLSGVPHLAEQFSGLKTNAVARLQIRSGYNAILKLENVRLRVMNEKLKEMPVNDFIADHYWQELPQEQEVSFQECFQNPIKFRFENGRVQSDSLEVSDDQAEWCTNIQKAVVSLFQLDLQQQNQLEDISPLMADLVQENSMSWDKSYDKAYRVMEEGIDGECESVYLLNEPISYYSKEKNNQMMLTKVRNYENCRRKPIYTEGVLSSYLINPDNQQNISIVQSFNHIDYELTGDRNDFAIQSLKQISKQVMEPSKQENGEVATFSVQRLRLRESRDTVNDIQTPRSTRKLTEGLLMKFEEEEKNSPSSMWSFTSSKQRTQFIVQLVEEYYQQCTPVVREESQQTLRQLMFQLRASSYEEIKSALEELKEKLERSRSEEERQIQDNKLRTLLDIIPTVGQTKVVKILTYIIENQKTFQLYEHELPTMINMYALTAKPTAEAIKQLLPSSSFFRLPQMLNDGQLRRSVILALGTLHHGLYKAQKYDPIPREDYNKITKQYIRDLEELYRTSRQQQDKYSVLKAIGNCGLPEFYPFVEKIVQDRSLPLSLRMNAVTATRRMPQEISRKIHSLLLPVYTSQNEPKALRMLCFYTIIQSQPSYGVVQTIVHSMIAEKSEKVGAFVYSHLLDVANSERESYRKIRQYVQVLIKQVKPFISKQRYSSTYSFDMLSKEMGLGEYIDLLNVYSERTDLPYAFAGAFGTTLFGREFRVLEGGVYQRGIEEILNRLVGPTSFLREVRLNEDYISKQVINIIKEVLKPQKPVNQGRVQESIERIIEKLGLKERLSEDLLYGSYLRILGNEIRYWLLNQQDIHQYIRWMEEQPSYDYILRFVQKLIDGKEINLQHTMTAQTSIMIPTAFGLPLYLNQTYTHQLRTTGQITLHGQPLEYIAGKQNLKLQVDIRPSATLQVRYNIGLHLPQVRCGVETESSVKVQGPVPLTMTLNSNKRSVSFKYIQPQEQEELIQMKHVPYTYLNIMSIRPAQIPYKPRQMEITNQRLVKPVTITVPFESEELGLTFQENFVVPSSIASFTSAFPLSGRYTYQCLVKPQPTRGEKSVEMTIELPKDQAAEYTGYRTSDRHEGSLEEKARKHCSTPQIHSSLRSQSIRNIYINVNTKNSNKEIDFLTCFQLTIEPTPRHIYQINKFQIDIETHNTINNYKFFTSTLVDIEALLEPHQTSEQMVAKFEAGYGRQSYRDYYGAIQVYNGDKNAEIQIPVEPKALHYVRQLFGLKEVMSSGEHQREDSWGSWLFGGKSSEEIYENQRITRGVRKMTDVPSTVRKYHVEVDYEKCPEYMTDYVRRAYYYLMYRNNDYAAYVQRNQPQQQGKLELIIRYFPSLEKTHLLINTPELPELETVFFFPTFLSKYQRSLRYDPYHSRSEKSKHYPESPVSVYEDEESRVSGECTLQQTQSSEKLVLTTFDGMTYQLPIKHHECEMLIAKDCTSSHLFTVLGQKKEDSQIVRVLLPQTEIVVLSSWTTGAQIKVNGEVKVIKEGEKTEIVIKSQYDEMLAELTQVGSTVIIRVPRLGLNVDVAQKEVKVKSGKWNQGNLCGLCGDYNNDKQRELTGPKMKWYSNEREFVMSYLLPSHQCEMDKVMEDMGLHPASKDECVPELRNIVIPREQVRVDDLICISIKPVPMCPRQCTPSNKKSQRVSVHCLPSYSPYTQRLLEESKYRPLYEMENKQHDRTIDVSIPEECHPQY